MASRDFDIQGPSTNAGSSKFPKLWDNNRGLKTANYRQEITKSDPAITAYQNKSQIQFFDFDIDCGSNRNRLCISAPAIASAITKIKRTSQKRLWGKISPLIAYRDMTTANTTFPETDAKEPTPYDL